MSKKSDQAQQDADDKAADEEAAAAEKSSAKPSWGRGVPTKEDPILTVEDRVERLERLCTRFHGPIEEWDTAGAVPTPAPEPQE